MLWRVAVETERGRRLCLSCLAMASKCWRESASANMQSSISFEVMLRKTGSGKSICLITEWESWVRRERGRWTRERETGRTDMVTHMKE